MLNDASIQLALAHPLVVVLIALGVLALWRADPRRPRYLFYFGLSYLLYAAGVTSQVVLVPSSRAYNVLFSGMMYLVAVTVFAQGLIALSGARPRYAAPAAILIAALACRAYFLFIEENGVMRSYCLNGAVFLVFSHGAVVARNLRKGLLAERVAYYAFVLFTLTTVPRALLVTTKPSGDYGFDFSAYWIFTQVSIYAFAPAFALALIVTIVQRNARAKTISDKNLSLISHDLRAPLATIVGNLRLLEKTASPEQIAHMRAIERSTQYQASLIEDILAGGHDDFRLLKVDPRPVQVDAFLTELCVHGRTWCLARNNDFSLRVLTELPAQIQTDQRRLKQVLLNLISNAALATRHGDIALHVAASPAEPGSATLEFRVLDTGPGIEADLLAMLFQENQRPDEKWHGTGLGLYIAQRIAKNMGGVLEVASEPGKGSCFSLVLRVPACSSSLLPAGWRPLESNLETGAAAAVQQSLPAGKLPKVVREQLAEYALQGSYSDIDDLLESAVFSSSCHDGFRTAVKAALDELNFDAIHELAQRG